MYSSVSIVFYFMSNIFDSCNCFIMNTSENTFHHLAHTLLLYLQNDNPFPLSFPKIGVWISSLNTVGDQVGEAVLTGLSPLWSRVRIPLGPEQACGFRFIVPDYVESGGFLPYLKPNIRPAPSYSFRAFFRPLLLSVLKAILRKKYRLRKPLPMRHCHQTVPPYVCIALLILWYIRTCFCNRYSYNLSPRRMC